MSVCLSNAARSRWAIALMAAASLLLPGCSDGRLTTVPVEGKVLYRGQPLPFGYILFQPGAGPVGRADIQPDGTFRLSTYGEYDGAVLGEHHVQIICNESMRPGHQAGASDESAGGGKALIPEKYFRYDTSGIQLEVQPANQPFIIQLD